MKLKMNFELEKIEKLILKLSYPSIIAMTVNALYNIIDGIFLGRFIGTKALAATNSVFPLIAFFMALSAMSGVGLSSIISRTLGKKREKMALSYTGISIIGSILMGLLIFIFGIIFGNFLLKISGAAPEIFKESQEYFFSILFGWIVYPFIVIINNLLRAIGQAKKASFLMLFGIIINIFLVPIFVLIFKFKIIGVGCATSISQILSLLVVYFYFKKNILPIKINKKYFKFNLRILFKIYSYGLSSFLRQFINSFNILIYNHFFLIYGGINYLSAMGIINKIYSLILLPIFGLLQGIQPVTGYNYGSKNFKRVKESVLKGTYFCFFLSLFLMIIIILNKNYILNIFTNDEKVLFIAKEGLIYACIFLPLISFQMVGTSSFQAFGQVSVALFIAIIRQLIFGIPILIILSKIFGIIGVWVSFPVADLLSAMVCIIITQFKLSKIKNKWEKKICY